MFFKFHDHGDLNVKKDEPMVMVEKVKKFTATLLEKNKFPIALGGEHSITLGIIQAFPDDIAVLSLDAHLDFREQYENERYNHACVIRHIADHIDIKNIAVIGIRSAEKEEFKYAKNPCLIRGHRHQVKEKHAPEAEKWLGVFFFLRWYNVQV